MNQFFKRDRLGGKQRILLSDFIPELPEKVTAEEMLKAWRMVYPHVPIVRFTDNIMYVTIADGASEYATPQFAEDEEVVVEHDMPKKKRK
jgi:hypothetical protein